MLSKCCKSRQRNTMTGLLSTLTRRNQQFSFWSRGVGWHTRRSVCRLRTHPLARAQPSASQFARGVCSVTTLLRCLWPTPRLHMSTGDGDDLEPSVASASGEAPLPTRVGEFELDDHESHQLIPVVVVPVAGYGSQFLKEPGSSSPNGPEQPVAAIGKIQQRVQQKS